MFRENNKYTIEKDPVGRCTLTMKDVADSDQGEWTAYINDEVFSKVLVNVEGEQLQ
jgi:hypothetical protein